MTWNTTDVRRKCQHPLTIAAGTLPLPVLLVMNTLPDALRRMLLLPAAFVLLAWGCMVLPSKRRLIGGVAGAAAISAIGLAALPVGMHRTLLLLPLLYAVLLMLTLPIGGWTRDQELSPLWGGTGVTAHVVAQIAVNVARRTGNLLYEPASGLLLFSFLLFAALVMLSLNRASLDNAGQSRRRVPLQMRRVNMALTFLLLVLAVLIASIPAIGTVLSGLWNLLLRGVAMLTMFLLSLFPQTESLGQAAPAPGNMGAFGAGETVEPSALALILEKVALIVALIVLAAAAFFLVRALVRKLRQLIRYLMERLRQYSAATGEDYEDEITDTRDDAEHDSTGLFTRLRNRMPRVDESKLSPTERVRRRYLRLKLRRGWRKADTARQTLPEEAAALYEQARYSGHPLTEAQADSFREKTRQL